MKNKRNVLYCYIGNFEVIMPDLDVVKFEYVFGYFFSSFIVAYNISFIVDVVNIDQLVTQWCHQRRSKVNLCSFHSLPWVWHKKPLCIFFYALLNDNCHKLQCSYVLAAQPSFCSLCIHGKMKTWKCISLRSGSWGTGAWALEGLGERGEGRACNEGPAFRITPTN